MLDNVQLITSHGFDAKRNGNCETCRFTFQSETSTFAIRRSPDEAGPSYVRAKDMVSEVAESKRDQVLFIYGDNQFYVDVKAEIRGYTHLFSTKAIDVTKYKFGCSVYHLFDTNGGKLTYKPDGYSLEDRIAVDMKSVFTMMQKMVILENIIEKLAMKKIPNGVFCAYLISFCSWKRWSHGYEF